MNNKNQIIYDILKELDLLQYWEDLSSHQLSDIVDESTNSVDEGRFEKVFSFLNEQDKLRIKYALRNNLDLDNQVEMEYDSESKPASNSAKVIDSNETASNTTRKVIETWNEPNIANGRAIDRNIATIDSPTKKAKTDDITCVHHISYKVVGPNNFVPSYTKRYYIESTGEEVYTTTPEDNHPTSSGTKSLGKASPTRLHNNYEHPSSSHNPQTTYNRSYYHPYHGVPLRYYSHNRMSSEPARHQLHGFYSATNAPLQPPPTNTNPLPTMYRTHPTAISPNSTVSLNQLSSGHPDYKRHPQYNEVYPNNYRVYPPSNSASLPNYCPIFEGSKAMENSPLHKYNLLDPPIFKYHSIRIPTRIPFLIRLDSLDEDRVNMIKNASIIFGRSDNRRKSSSLNLNEMLMNEVAFQLCLRDPLYLISRQKLIMESREIIRESGHRIQDDINIIPFEESTSKTDKNCTNENSSVDNHPIQATPDTYSVNNVNYSNKVVTNSIQNLTISNDVKTISEVRDAPIVPSAKSNVTDPFFIQDEPSSVQSRNLMAKYCYDDYDTIYYYKVHRKWPPNADSSRKAYLRRKSKKFKIIDNYLYSVSSFSERLRLWLRDINAVVEHAPRFHFKENGEHFTRNETISRMLRYCYSNDIAQGVTKYIQTCEVCAEKEWRDRGSGENTVSIDVKLHNSLVNHQLLSPTSNPGDSSSNSHVRNMLTKSVKTPTSDLTNEDRYVYYSSENSSENKGSSSGSSNLVEDENSTPAPNQPTNFKSKQNVTSVTKNNNNKDKTVVSQLNSQNIEGNHPLNDSSS